MDAVDPFDAETTRRAAGEPQLVVDLRGFEGPLDLLLDLARRQTVDLREISILALAEQYLAFVEDARSLRLELAADYLVMAAWLAFLKSRLLLPEPPRPEEPSAGELATALAGRLRRLDAVRAAAARLAERPQLGRDVFARGEAASPSPQADAPAEATLLDLLTAYARQQARSSPPRIAFASRAVWGLAEARAALERLLGRRPGWVELDERLGGSPAKPGMAATVIASSLSAALEMVREGQAELRQERPFEALLLRRADPPLRLVAA